MDYVLEHEHWPHKLQSPLVDADQLEHQLEHLGNAQYILSDFGILPSEQDVAAQQEEEEVQDHQILILKD